MKTWRTFIACAGVVAGVMGAAVTAPASAHPVLAAQSEALLEASEERGIMAAIAPNVAAEADAARLHKAGYAGRPGWRRHRHGWRGHRRGRGRGRGRVTIIERPCTTRIIRKTRRGRVVRIINHCGYGHRPYW